MLNELHRSAATTARLLVKGMPLFSLLLLLLILLLLLKIPGGKLEL
jgi:hypothetical protein